MKLNEIAMQPKFKPSDTQDIDVVLYNRETDEEAEAKLKVGMNGDEVDFIQVLEPFAFMGKNFEAGEYVDNEDIEPFIGDNWAEEKFGERTQRDHEDFQASADDWADSQNKHRREEGF